MTQMIETGVPNARRIHYADLPTARALDLAPRIIVAILRMVVPILIPVII